MVYQVCSHRRNIRSDTNLDKITRFISVALYTGKPINAVYIREIEIKVRIGIDTDKFPIITYDRSCRRTSRRIKSDMIFKIK